VCRTIDKNLKCLFKSIGSEEHMRAMESTKRILCCKEASEEKRF